MRVGELLLKSSRNSNYIVYSQHGTDHDARKIVDEGAIYRLPAWVSELKIKDFYIEKDKFYIVVKKVKLHGFLERGNK